MTDQPPPAAPAEIPKPEPPPAASAVARGGLTEKEIELARQLKAREARIAELEDNLHRITKPPAPADPAAEKKRGWLDGLTLLDDCE